MSEYFRPSKIWVGKLCYVKFGIRYTSRWLFLPCRISKVIDKLHVEVCAIGSDSCHVCDIDDLVDRIDGETTFHDIPGGKP